MDRSITTLGLVVGIAIGFVGGIAFAVVRRAWVDVKKGQTQLTGLRKTAWVATRMATTRLGLISLLVIAAVAWAAIGPK